MLILDQSQNLLSLISQPWHWSISGLLIALVLFTLNWLGRKFGISSSFETACSIAGAGNRFDYFKRNIKDDFWLLAFVGGAILGGAITANFLPSPDPVAISEATVAGLADLGIDYKDPAQAGIGFIPEAIFNFGNIKGLFLALLGGFLVGFGARYGRGCTSGHAITGMAHFQLPSLLTVIGFFIGGFIMVYGIFPWLFQVLQV